MTHPNLHDEDENRARRALLAATRGDGEGRELFTDFPARVRWVWAELTPNELARVRHVEYSYWREVSGGSRLPTEAAKRIKDGFRHSASRTNASWLPPALAQGERFPPLILAGQRRDALVCLEGHLRLTAHALVGFPVSLECLVGTARTMGRWAL